MRKLRQITRTWPLKLIFGVLSGLLFIKLILRSSDQSQLTGIILPEKIVHFAKGNNAEILLVTLIMTGPKNVDQRKAIRETWLSQTNMFSKEDLIQYFVIGVKNLPAVMLDEILEEQNTHKDLLLLEELEDAYEKLSQKLGLMLEWVYYNIKCKYVLKVDDDTYVRLDKVLYDLKHDPDKQSNNLYWGYFYGRAHVKQSGHWKETEWKLCDYYIPYARGGGYVLSSHLVEFVAKNWQQFKIYLSEDVTLGAWLAPLKLTRVHDVRFDTEYKSRGCKNEFIISHKQTIDDMNTKFNSLMSFGKLCKNEISFFHGYIYDWSVPPSKCCVRSEGIP